jgi:hypothetical protein
MRALLFKLEMDVDLVSHRQTAPPQFTKRPFFARVHYFLVHRYDNREFQLALVQFTKDIAPKDFGLLETTAGWSRQEIVDVRCIENVAGYIARGNKWYLIA